MTHGALRWAGLGLLAALLGLLAVTTLVAVREARTDLLAGQAALQQAQGAALDGEIDAAHDALVQARGEFANGRDALDSPSLDVAGLVPGVGRNIDTARTLAEAGQRLADAGAEVTGAVAGLPDGVEAFAPRDGAIPLEPLGEVAGPLRRAAEQAEAAEEAVAATPTTWLAGPLHEARATADRRAGQAAESLRAGAALAEQLPAFLGADEPRRYFLGAQNPAELRGTGGLIGAFAILTADEGRLDVGEFDSVGSLTNRAPDELPPPSEDFASRYERYSSGTHGSNINMTPDMPTAATAIERLHEAATGQAVDGTILADPVMLKALLEVVGPTEVPGVGTVEADSVVRFVTVDQYEELAEAEDRKELLGEVAKGVLERFLADGGDDPLEAVQALAEAAGTGRLQLHARDEGVQEAFVTAGVDGALADPAGDYLAVVGNNAAANKLDTFLEQTAVYDVYLRPDGSARGELTVDLTNTAPASGLNPTVLGPSPNVADELSAGENRTIWSVYCAPGCRLDAFRRDGEAEGAASERERDRPVYTTSTTLGSGEEQRLSFDWVTQRAWDPERGRYRLTVDGQPTLADATTTVRVHPPEGSAIEPTGDGLRIRAGTAVWSGDPAGGVVLSADVRDAAGDPVQAAKRLLNRPLVSLFGGE